MSHILHSQMETFICQNGVTQDRDVTVRDPRATQRGALLPLGFNPIITCIMSCVVVSLFHAEVVVYWILFRRAFAA